MVTIVVQDHSTAVGTDEFREIVAAVGKQVRRDFSPHWHTTAKLATSGPRTAWQVVVVDDPDQADALGYHDLTPQGRPLGKVFAQPALEDGMSVSEVLSHEVLEMLCDPLVNKAAQDDESGLFYAYEIADPTQQDGYEIEGVTVSNFVCPAWFQRRGWGKLDFLGTLTEPFSLAEGGYISVNDGAGWGQLYGSEQVEARMQARQSVVGFGPREELRRR